MNILRVLDTRLLLRKPVPRSFARQILRLPEQEPLESWLATLPSKASNLKEGRRLQQELKHCLQPALKDEPNSSPLSGVKSRLEKLHPITYSQTATRSFEKAWWNDICRLSKGEYVNKDNADCVHDPATLARLLHRHRDLERMGDYLLSRHLDAIAAAEMER